MNIDPSIRKLLDNEATIHEAQIRALFQTLDRKFGLRGLLYLSALVTMKLYLALIPRLLPTKKESFYFSLLFIGYAVKKPLSKEDRLDLYKHEYAHYMQYNMKIPAQYNWQAGKHGSAWKYCCSLVGAAPTPYYRIGESLLKHDYDKALKNPIHDKTVPIRDTYRREQAYKSAKHSEIKFQVNDMVTHPKFGEGTVEEIVQLSNSVRLHIRFADDEVKKIDQKWLLRSGHK